MVWTLLRGCKGKAGRTAGEKCSVCGYFASVLGLRSYLPDGHEDKKLN